MNAKVRKGFTLVELLVVIGIIALLISILLPSLGKARQQAQTAACMSNLRSIGQLVAIYQAENKGVFPPLSTYANSGGFTGSNYRGYNLWGLIKVKPGSNIAVCPTNLANMEPPTWGVAQNGVRALYTYKYNWFVAGAETNGAVSPDMPHAVRQSDGVTWAPNPMKKVKNASDTLMFADYPQLVAFQTDDLSGSDRGMDQASLKPGQPLLQNVDGVPHQVIRGIAPVHGRIEKSRFGGTLSDGSIARQGLTNVLYCDGSVRSARVAQGQFNLTADPARRYLLNDSSANGNCLAGNASIVEDTRLNPLLAQ